MLTRSKKRLLLSSRLYLILDRNSCYPSDVISIFRRVGRIGVDLVQLRENTACDRDFLRDAKAIKRICKEKGIIFIINNRLDIAQLAGADGLHLGQTDLPLKEVRKIFGKNRIVGVSCHNLTEALKAQSEGADYIGIGPIFSTTIKPNLKPIKLSSIKLINQKIKIPKAFRLKVERLKR